LKPESKFWKLIKKNLTDISWTRFENWASPGVPDVYGIKDGISVWVELKVITSNQIKLSPFQKAWNYNHSLQGGRNFIIATTHDQRLLYIFPGIEALSIVSIAKLPQSHWCIKLMGGPGPWQQVREILLHSPLPKPEAK
tara:strand:- start:111 stop:527 length:417 start_codon:yes stop_codon:yes gene_type:complete